MTTTTTTTARQAQIQRADAFADEHLQALAAEVMAWPHEPHTGRHLRELAEMFEWSDDPLASAQNAVSRAALRAALSAPPAAQDAPPIDMVLHCPACGLQHIDQPETDAEYTERLHESSWWDLGGDKPARWTNPHHKSHECRKIHGGCGHIWRPADVPTNGVAVVKTKGKADSPIAARASQPATPAAHPVAGQGQAVPDFDDPRVQKVYEFLESAESAGADKEHWEAWAARQIVALFGPAWHVVNMAREWSAERSPQDTMDAALLKAIATMDGDWPGCEGCDFECGEPCTPATVAEQHAAVDAALAKFQADRLADGKAKNERLLKALNANRAAPTAPQAPALVPLTEWQELESALKEIAWSNDSKWQAQRAKEALERVGITPTTKEQQA